MCYGTRLAEELRPYLHEGARERRHAGVDLQVLDELAVGEQRGDAQNVLDDVHVICHLIEVGILLRLGCELVHIGNVEKREA